MLRLSFLFLLLLGGGTWLMAQEQESNYDHQALFAPMFYNSNGNGYRSASGVPGPNYWQNRVDYDIDVELLPENHRVQGTVKIHYTNNSPDALPYLWLQLDQNLFKPDSRGEAMIRQGSRYGSRGEKIEGGYDISKVKVSQGEFSYIIEDTRMQVRLAKPLAAKGGKITISMDFSFPVPVNGSDRMGHLATKNGEIYTIAQWFPRMAVYDDVLGWNTNPYLGAGEFYCEFGDINLNITAPANHTVMASGALLNAKSVFDKEHYQRWEKAKKSNEVVNVITEEEVAKMASQTTNKKKTWQYRIENTRDAAWASSKAFVLDAVKIDLPSGKDCLSVAAHPVESNTQDSYGRAAEYIKGSIEHYSKMWLEYPYPMAINIASNQGGMEYPGIVFCGWKAKNESCWGVIDHEFGHIWFPMIVGSNERKFGWMDEGFNTFINSLSSAEFNNGEYAESGALPVARAASSIFTPEREFIMLTPDALQERNIGIQLYWKPAMGLQVLREDILGKDRFDYAFKQYIHAWAFKHPQPEDFFRVMENAAGEDLGWFWRSWFLSDAKLDQSIASVTQDANEPARITIQNLEEMAMPLQVKITYADGSTEWHKQGVDVWMRNASWDVYSDKAISVQKVELDADNRFPDVNRANNLWPRAADAAN